MRAKTHRWVSPRFARLNPSYNESCAWLGQQHRAAAAKFRVVFQGRFPVEAVDRKHQPVLVGAPTDVGDLEDRVLEVGGDDLDVVPVECDQFEWIHGRKPRVR